MSTGKTTELRFTIEWQPSEDVRAPELAATWADLQIWAGPECITTVEDLQTSSARRSMYCSLYPLAEWIAFNWWFLQANQRTAALEVRSLFDWSFDHGSAGSLLDHHLLRSAGDGFLFPRLAIIPEGAITRLTWFADPEPRDGASIRFMSSGEHLASSEEVRHALGEFIEAVITRLREQEIRDSELEREWAAVRSASPDEQEFCAAAARLGLDAYAIDPKIAAVIEKADEILRPSIRDEFLDAAEPSVAALAKGLVWIKRGLGRIDRVDNPPGEDLGRLKQRLKGNPAAGATPWAKGYEQAKLVRSALGVSVGRPLGLEGFMARGKATTPGPAFQGLGAQSRKGIAAVILSGELRVASARFAEARALWHFMFRADEGPFLLTWAHGQTQRAERAFAAELLAPAAGLLEQLDRKPTIVSVDETEALADHFRVSPMVVEHQLENQLGATVA